MDWTGSSISTKPKRGLVKGHAGHEEAQSERHQLTLRHDAESFTLITVDGDSHLDLALTGPSHRCELYLFKCDVGPFRNLVLDRLDLTPDRFKTLVSHRRFAVL